MKSRTFFSAIAVLAGFILLLGIAGFWGLTAQNPRALLTEGGQITPTAAQFVPRQAPIMVSLLARPDRLWSLRQVLTAPGKRFKAQQEWQALKTTLADLVGWEYDVDVRPWLDEELTFAVTTADLDHDSSNGLQTGYLAVFSCQDGQKAREAIHLLWQQRIASGQTLIFETVSGIPLIYNQKPVDPFLSSLKTESKQPAIKIASLASAVISDRYVLLANHPQVLRQAIATFQAPDVSLAQASTYQASIQALSNNRIGWLYAHVPTLLTWLGLEEPELNRSIPERGRRVDHLFLSFRATLTGLLGNAAIAAAPGTAFKADDGATQESQTPKLLDILPAETRFVTSGKNLSALLSETAQNVGGYSIVQRSLNALLVSLSLPSDLTSSQLWESFSGSYALGLLSGPKPTWILATQIKGDTPFDTFDALAQQQGLTVSHIPFGQQDLTTWTQLSIIPKTPNSPTNLETKVIGVHTQINGYAIFSTSLLGLQQVIQIDKQASLSEQSAFVSLMNSLEQSYEDDGDIAYIDWPRLAPALANRFPWLRVIEQAGQPFTAHLGPILLSGRSNDQSLQEGIVAIKLRETQPRLPDN